ncbi:MAG: O-antigen ligase family protein [Candidatus Omnitrophota bacterium]
MAFFLLCLTVFIMFFQPTYIFPWSEQYQPLRICAIAALFFYFFSDKKSNANFFSYKINLYFVLFIFWQTLSSFTIWSQAGLDTLNLWLKLGIVYYLIFKSVTNEKKLITIIFTIILALGYLCYYAITNFIINYTPGIRASGFGWYENANDLSLIFVAVIPLSFLVINLTNKLFIKLFYLFCSASFAFTVLFTGSRNGLLGVAVVGFFSTIFAKKLPKVIRGSVLVILVLAISSIGVASVLSRSNITGLRGDDSSEDRIIQWKAGMRMIAVRPLFGVGRDEFGSYAEEYGGIRGMQPHNTLIQVFAESGIPAGIFFSLFSLLPLWIMCKDFKYENSFSHEKAKNITAYKYLWVSLLGFWACAFFGNRYHAYILFVVIALIVTVKANMIGFEDNSQKQKEILHGV